MFDGGEGTRAGAAGVPGDRDEIGARLGLSTTTLAIAWLLRLPCRPIPVIGSRRLSASDEAAAALGVTLSADDWYRIWGASTGHEVP